MNKNLCLLFVLGLFPELLHSQTPTPLLTHLPAEARNQLEKNAAAMATIHFEYTETQEGDVPDDYAGPTTYTCSYHERNFYTREERLHPRKPSGVSRRVHENAFDKDILYFGERREGHRTPAVLAKYLCSDTTDPDYKLRLIVNPYLQAAGFYAPETISELNEKGDNHLMQSLVLHYLKRSDSTRIQETNNKLHVTVQIPDPALAGLEGMDEYRFRKSLEAGANSPEEITKALAIFKYHQQMVPKRTVKFVLDPQRAYAVIQREDSTHAGRPILSLNFDQWKHYDMPGIWLASYAVESHHPNAYRPPEYANEKARKARYELRRVEFATPEDVKFALDYKEAGTSIRDRSTLEARKSPSHEINYTVSANGTLLRQAADSAMGEVKRGRFILWFIVVNIVVLSAFVIARLRAARKQPAG